MSFTHEVVNHLRLTWRLFWDEQVRWWQRAIFAIPLVYLFIPFRYNLFADWTPLVGLLDDWLLALFCSYIFVAICPRPVVRRVRMAISLSDPDAAVRERARAESAALEGLPPVERLEMYRHPKESPSLALSLLVLVGLSVLGGMVVSVGLALLLGLALVTARVSQNRILRRATRVDAKRYPKAQACWDRCTACLPPVQANLFVLDSPDLNAYTFGLERPYAMVLCSGLIEHLDVDELAVVVSHELGHVLFEHTFLSSALGGILYHAGPAGFLWSLTFFRWRRTAELTADRIALLVCGELEICVSTVAKLALGLVGERVDVQAVLRHVYDQRGRRVRGHLGELMATHPLVVRRIQALVDFDAELVALDVERWLTTSNAS